MHTKDLEVVLRVNVLSRHAAVEAEENCESLGLSVRAVYKPAKI
jgi:hypothetical protein